MSQSIVDRAVARRVPASAEAGIACTLPAAPRRRPLFPRSCSYTQSVLGLERIFDDEVSVCIWRRAADPDLAKYLSGCLFTQPLELVERIDDAAASLEAILPHFPASPLRARFAQDIHALVELFATLTAAARIGLRLCVTRAPMCPRFHVDHVGLRLLSTWVGPGTEWLEHNDVDRRFLALGGGHVPDEASGLLLPGAQIHRMRAFDVALMKGERFANHEGRGTVHRSPHTRDRGAVANHDLSRRSGLTLRSTRSGELRAIFRVAMRVRHRWAERAPRAELNMSVRQCERLSTTNR